MCSSTRSRSSQKSFLGSQTVGTQVSRFSEEVLSQVARLSLTRSSTQPSSKLKEIVPNKACQTSSNSPSAYHRPLDFADSVQHGWGVVHIREGQVRDRNAKELTEGSPTFFHLPDKQSICWHLFDHLCFPGLKEPDSLFLSALNSAKQASWKFRAQWSWSVASSRRHHADGSLPG